MRTMCTSVNGFLPRCARTTRRTAWRAASSIRPSSPRSAALRSASISLQAGDDGLGQLAVLVARCRAGDTLRRRHGPALAVDHQGGRGRAVPQELAPLAQRLAVERHHAVAVERQPAGRHLVDDLGRPGRQADQRAVGRHDRLRHLAGAGERGVLDQMARPRHAPARRSAAGSSDTSRTSSSRAGWPETWTKWSRSVTTSTPRADQRVLQPADRALVAGNDARGEDHRVARLEHEVADARRRRCGPAPRAARPGCRCR